MNKGSEKCGTSGSRLCLFSVDGEEEEEAEAKEEDEKRRGNRL